MRPLDFARTIETTVADAAERTRAFGRGNVESVTDGRGVIVLRNGAKVRIYESPIFKFGLGQSVNLLRDGSSLQAHTPSAFGGGNGAPFDPG